MRHVLCCSAAALSETDGVSCERRPAARAVITGRRCARHNPLSSSSSRSSSHGPGSGDGLRAPARSRARAGPAANRRAGWAGAARRRSRGVSHRLPSLSPTFRREVRTSPGRIPGASAPCAVAVSGFARGKKQTRGRSAPARRAASVAICLRVSRCSEDRAQIVIAPQHEGARPRGLTRPRRCRVVTMVPTFAASSSSRPGRSSWRRRARHAVPPRLLQRSRKRGKRVFVADGRERRIPSPVSRSVAPATPSPIPPGRHVPPRNVPEPFPRDSR